AADEADATARGRTARGQRRIDTVDTHAPGDVGEARLLDAAREQQAFIALRRADHAIRLAEAGEIHVVHPGGTPRAPAVHVGDVSWARRAGRRPGERGDAGVRVDDVWRPGASQLAEALDRGPE